jgi:hypothetical protein
MKRRTLRTAAAILALVALEAVAEDDEWALAKSEDGIEVYTRDVEGFDVREFRASAVVPAPLSAVIAWWRDPTTYTRWINRCSEARLIEVESGENANYMKFNFPFPASDRDVVVRARTIEMSATRVVFEGSNVDGLVPEVSGLVRIAMLRSRWEFSARGDAVTEVVYRQHMDAGGSLPAFILNRAAVDSPFQTLRGLIRFAEANRSR